MMFTKTADLMPADGFSTAFPKYMDLFKTDSSNESLNYKIGVSYLNSRSQKTKAVPYLEKAVASLNSYTANGASVKSEVPLIAYKYLGDAYIYSYKFDLAISSFEKFKIILPNDKNTDQRILEELNWKIKLCKIARESEGLIVCPKGVVNEDKKYFEETDFSGIKDSLALVAEKFYSSYVPPGKNVKIKGTETTVATSVDGQMVLVYKSDKKNGSLYASRLSDNQWTEPEKLSANLNENGWEPDEFVSADGKTLYFSSNRAGGFGGMDIYKCKKIPNGEWSKAINLGPVINSAFDEKNPFIYPDGATLYFNSNRFKNKEEFDIYSSILSISGGWKPPLNIGFPTSNAKDDADYTVASSENIVDASLLKKEKYPALKKEKYTDKDTYIITFFDTKHIPLTLIKGGIIGADGKIIKDPEINVTDNKTGEILGVYHCNNKGEYMFIIPQERNINITYKSEGYLFQSANINILTDNNYYQKAPPLYLQPIETNSKIILDNIFFESDKTSLSDLSKTELENVFQLLTKNPGIEVEIAGYASPKTSKESARERMKLAEERAASVINYLVEKGINKNRLFVNAYGKAEEEKPGLKISGDKNDEKLNWLELKVLKITW
ncbi:MAG: OmpA family protein [Bacteroidia bacterium]